MKKFYLNKRLLLNIAFLVFLITSLISCQRRFDLLQAPAEINNKKPDCETCSILFIGSSYLSYVENDVVDIFSQMAAAGGKSIEVGRRIQGGQRMIHHSQSEITLAKINERKWNYVILQGNSALISKEKWQYMFAPYVIKLKNFIKANHPETCIIYMMPWAYLDGLGWIEGETDTYEQMQQNIYDETTRIMKELDIAIAPAGWAWYQAYTNGQSEDLYLNDYNHQGKTGAYLTACVFYSTIFLEKAPRISIELPDLYSGEYLPELAYTIVINDLELWNIY